MIALMAMLVMIIVWSAISAPLNRRGITPPLFLTATGLLASLIVPWALDLELDAHDAERVAEVALVLLLFSDATRLNLRSIRHQLGLAQPTPLHRIAAHDRRGCGRGTAHLPGHGDRLGVPARVDPRAHRRGARSEGDLRPIGSGARPSDARYRERPQRRPRRAVLHRRPVDRERGTRRRRHGSRRREHGRADRRGTDRRGARGRSRWSPVPDRRSPRLALERVAADSRAHHCALGLCHCAPAGRERIHRGLCRRHPLRHPRRSGPIRGESFRRRSG